MNKIIKRSVDITAELAANGVVDIEAHQKAGDRNFSFQIQGILIAAAQLANTANVDGILSGEGPANRQVYPFQTGDIREFQFHKIFAANTTATQIILCGIVA